MSIGAEPNWAVHRASLSKNPDSIDSPEQATDRKLMQILIESYTGELPETLRTVSMLRGLEKMSVEEAAACPGIPEATVRTQYFRATGLL
jgi:RNA polymerase sigma-70 factor (ECF subfamily)